MLVTEWTLAQIGDRAQILAEQWTLLKTLKDQVVVMYR